MRMAMRKKKMRMKKRKRRKKISEEFDFGFFLLYQFVYFFYCRMVIFLYLFLLFVAFIHEWAKPFLFSFVWFCYALRCFSKAKKVIFRFVVPPCVRRFFVALFCLQ